jgi:hypothetical protein
MVFGRLISLLLSAALVACPSVCRAGACSECPTEPTKTITCAHCQTGQSIPLSSQNCSNQSSPVPLKPKSHCELGNCLCAGALTNGGGLDLQIGHVLDVFAAVATLSEPAEPAILSTREIAVAADHDDPQASGRSLRLRIESLLI